MADLPILKAHEITKDFLYPKVGYFNVIVEVSVTQMRYMVVSQTEIWRYYIHPPMTWSAWGRRLQSLKGEISTPLIPQLLETFGLVVQSEQVKLRTEDILESLKIEMKDFLAVLEANYGDMYILKPIGSLFNLPDSLKLLQQIMRNEAIVLDPVARALPENYQQLQQEIYQSENQKPRLKRNYFCNVIEINRNGSLNPRKYYIAGPSYVNVAGQQGSKAEERTRPTEKWRLPLWVAPNSYEFFVSIDSSEAGTQDADLINPLHRGRYEGSSKGNPVVELEFEIGKDIPRIRIENANRIEELLLSSTIHPKDIAETLKGQQVVSERRVFPQIVFLVDSFPTQLGVLIDELIRPAVQYCQEYIDPDTQFKMVLYGNYSRANDRTTPPFTTRWIQHPSGGNDWMRASTFLTLLEANVRYKHGIITSLRDQRFTGSLEKALYEINHELDWSEGDRLVISCGIGGPNSKDEIPSRYQRIDWEEEISKMQKNGIHSYAFFMNEMIDGTYDPQLHNAHLAWQSLGYDGFSDQFEFLQTSLPEELSYAQDFALGFIQDNAHVKSSFQIDKFIPWPMFRPYWQVDERFQDVADATTEQNPSDYDDDHLWDGED